MDRIKKIALDKVVWISLGIIVFLAYQDLMGASMFRIVGGFSGEIYTKMEPAYLKFFWLFAIGTIIVVALTYYLIRRDKSEAISLVAIPGILLISGWEDLLYYALGGHQFWGTTMPWLSKNVFLQFVAEAMGKTVVDSTSLFVSAIIGAIISYISYIYLKKAKW